MSDVIVTTYGYSTGFWGDMLTSYNGTTITYDGIGNPLNWRNATALTWEKRELQKVTFSANSYAQYEYNSDGIRLSKSYINPSNYYREDRDYVLDGTKIIKEHIYVSTLAGITNTDIYYVYDASGDVIGLHYNNALYTFQKNLQGDVVRIVDSTGTVVVEYTYDAWGKVLTTTGSLASTVGKYNPFRYRSYYYDTETGWYYLQSRYYDPTVCRFLNADGYVSTGQGILGFNMFAYCGNNPIMGYDPNGDLPILLPALGGAAKEIISIVAILLTFTVAVLPVVAPIENSSSIDISLPNITVSPIQIIKDFLTGKATKSKDKELVIAPDAVAEETEREKAQQKTTPYQEATRVGGKVILGSYLTKDEAITYIKSGLDVMCATSQDAYNLVWRFGPGSFFYEIDKGKEDDPNYYYHFHLRDIPGVHIWHKGAGNSEYLSKYPR